MKNRVLCYGVPATHESITALGNFYDPWAVSDYDAFVYDPSTLVHGQPNPPLDQAVPRRQIEIRDLVSRKGGVAVCLLRQNNSVRSSSGSTWGNYDVFNAVAGGVTNLIGDCLRNGSGAQIQIDPNAKGVSSGYLRVLTGAMRFVAYLDAPALRIQGLHGTTLAVDSVGHPIAVEFLIDTGRLCFLPIPENVPGDRVGAAIARLVELHYGGPTELEIPDWASTVVVPRADANDGKIAALETKKEQIDTEIAELQKRRADLLLYRVLLYGSGKSLLEPVVRSAFRLLGFRVPEPEEYSGEWDVELYPPGSAESAIAEIEGSSGSIDVDKYRQLLDYIQAEVIEGRDHKGILIGNGYRLKSPDQPERLAQFSHHALRGATKNHFCLLPTSELFKAVCTVLENPEDDGLKIKIRESILSAVGPWTFAGGAPSGQSAPATAR